MVQGDTDRDRDRRRHRRLELDPVRRRLARRARPRSSPTSSRSSPPTRSRRAPATSKSPTARCASPAPTAPIAFADLAKRPEATAGQAHGGRCLHAAGSRPIRTARIVAEVEIDRRPARPRIVNYVVVDDFGVTLNPLLLAGQVHGGAVQGIGQALMEQTRSTTRDSGQLVTALLMDYALPRAGDMPAFAFETRNVPCTDQSARRQGRGRGRRHRLLPGGHERDRRRAVARLQHPPCRHAGDARSGSGPRSRKRGDAADVNRL